MTYVEVYTSEELEKLLQAYEKVGWKTRGGADPLNWGVDALKRTECHIHVEFQDDYIIYVYPQTDKHSLLGVEQAIEKLNNLNMQTLREKIQQMSLKGTDKILVKHGLEKPAGFLTDEGREVLMDFLHRNYRDLLAKEVGEVMKEEDKK